MPWFCSLPVCCSAPRDKPDPAIDDDMNMTAYPVADEIRLKDILRTFWNHRVMALMFIVITTGAVTAAAYLLPKKYEASTVVSPTSSSSSNTSGALGSLSNNLAALAGVPLSSDPRKVEAIAVLQSEALAERYIRENNLLPILYAGKWDAAHSRWKVTDPQKIPTVWKANQFLKQNVVKVVTDSKTGLVTLTVTWTDPVLAATWANGLVRMANDYERNATLVESERNIAYLTDQAGKTDVIGIKQAIYSLLESEFDKAMLAKGNEEYSFKILDPATVPERASYPPKLVWILASIFISLSISIFAAFLRVALASDQAHVR